MKNLLLTVLLLAGLGAVAQTIRPGWIGYDKGCYH
jgi:hypothetical protein